MKSKIYLKLCEEKNVLDNGSQSGKFIKIAEGIPIDDVKCLRC